MVTTTFKQKTGLKINLPESANTTANHNINKKIELTIDATGNFTDNAGVGQQFSRQQLTTLKHKLIQLADKFTSYAFYYQC